MGWFKGLINHVHLRNSQVVPVYIDKDENLFHKRNYSKAMLKREPVSSDVIWNLTKRNNSHLVKFNGNQWSRNPYSFDGLHNQTASKNTLAITTSNKR